MTLASETVIVLRSGKKEVRVAAIYLNAKTHCAARAVAYASRLSIRLAGSQ